MGLDSANKSNKKDNLEHIEHLLRQSMNGIHVLFENSDVARILQKSLPDEEFFKDDNMGKIQHLLDGLIERESFIEKQRYLNSLDHESYEIVVRTYFHLLESTIRASHKVQH